MSYNTPDDLKLILEVPGGLTDLSLQAFLDDANLLVTELLGSTTLSIQRKTVVEKYLAAHLMTLLTERGGLTSSKVGDSQDNYLNIARMSTSGDIMGFNLTRWGQQAMVFDTTGTLRAATSKNLPALFNVLPHCQYRNYWICP